MSKVKDSDLICMFERPTEPVFMPKGNNNQVFDVPDDYIVDRYRPLRGSLSNRFGTETKVSLKKVQVPDLSVPLQIGRRDNFSLFFPKHRKCAARLIEILMGMKTREDFASATAYIRDRVNPYLFIYAYSVAILHRPDTKNVPVPSLCEVFPEKFVDGAIFNRAREELAIVDNDTARMTIEIPKDFSANDMDEEHRIAYFREDLGLNLHHWHWHLVYPFDGPRNIVAKDRRGELFYYMHQQINARYNFERFCNNLGRVKRLNNFYEPMAEAYFPKLDSLVASRTWAPRFANTTMSDVDRELEGLSFDLQDMERFRDRIYGAIHSGVVVTDKGQSLDLTETQGIDILGNIVESSILSVNRGLYGDLHNFGHLAIALCHDPDHRNLETVSVMGDPATDIRDPMFFRWHAFVDDIFQEHKNTLPRYTVEQLNFPGVKINSVEVTSDGQPKNRLSTYWQKSNVDISNGLDFSPRGPLLVTFTHLQHSPFTYKLNIANSGGNKQGTVRIFLAPRVDERGSPMQMSEQRHLYIELDKFVVNLKGGNNVVERRSTQSSLTIPFERTFRDLTNRPRDGTVEGDKFNFCGCGWPQHLLIPRGTEAGFACQLFVMISDYNLDKVNQTGPLPPCSDAASYCGIRDRLYPDKRNMGFPFDRVPRDGVTTINDFLTPNMRVQDVTIMHNNRTIPAPQQKKQGNNRG